MKRRNPPRPLAALVATGICAALLGACGGSSKLSSTRSSTRAATTPALNAPGELNPPTSGTDFALRDSRSTLVRLSQYRGKAVLLTFLYSHCPDVCPLIVSQLRNALLKLGTQASRVQVVAVSVDPGRDTSKADTSTAATMSLKGARLAFRSHLNLPQIRTLYLPVGHDHPPVASWRV